MGATEDHYVGFKWIKVKRYKMDESLPWEQRYRRLEEHHVEETSFLIAEIRELAAKIDRLQTAR